MKITQDKLQVIDALIQRFPHIVFGGSIALNALGLIDREIGDIDVFYPDKAEYSAWLKTQPLNQSEYQNDVEMMGYLTHRIGVIIDGVNVCGFEVPLGKETESTVVSFAGRVIRVQNPIYAIVAKAIYGEKTAKHQADLVDIQRNLYKFINFYEQYSA